MTKFGKTCIVYTSDFECMEIYKNHNEWCTKLKFLGMIGSSAIPGSFTSI